jgi:hypothetical protein
MNEETKINKVSRYNWKNGAGEKARLQWLPIGKIKVDQEIQRQISTTTVMEIARNFDWAQFGSIDVAKRADGYYVFDGQHRFQAAVKRGDMLMLPCTVHDFNGDKKREAMALVERNTNVRRMDAYSKFRLRVLAQEETATAIQKMLENLGLVAGNADFPNCVRFIALVTANYTKSPKSCEDALICVRTLSGLTEQMHERIFKAVFYLVERFGVEKIMPHMLRLNNAGGKKTVLHAINGAIALSGMSGSSSRVMAQAVLNLINKGLRSGRLTMPEK